MLFNYNVYTINGLYKFLKDRQVEMLKEQPKCNLQFFYDEKRDTIKIFFETKNKTQSRIPGTNLFIYYFMVRYFTDYPKMNDIMKLEPLRDYLYTKYTLLDNFTITEYKHHLKIKKIDL
jgi:hypothetical protein